MIEGLDKVLQSLDDLADTDNLVKALGDACAIVEADAKKRAPKDTGELRRSITSEIEATGSTINGVVYTPLEYAPYIEYGTGLFAANGGGRQDVPWNYQDDKGNWHSTNGMKPNPFLIPALDDNREQIIKILEGALKK